MQFWFDLCEQRIRNWFEFFKRYRAKLHNKFRTGTRVIREKPNAQRCPKASKDKATISTTINQNTCTNMGVLDQTLIYSPLHKEGEERRGGGRAFGRRKGVAWSPAHSEKPARDWSALGRHMTNAVCTRQPLQNKSCLCRCISRRVAPLVHSHKHFGFVVFFRDLKRNCWSRRGLLVVFVVCFWFRWISRT